MKNVIHKYNEFDKLTEVEIVNLSERLPDLSKRPSQHALDMVVITLLTHLTLDQLTYVVNSLNEERTRRYADAA